MFTRSLMTALKRRTGDVLVPIVAACVAIMLLSSTALPDQIQRVHAQDGPVLDSKEQTSQPAGAPVIVAPFDSDYTYVDLGTPPGVPTPLGGVLFSSSDPNVLLVGGAANSPSGGLYAITVTRDLSGNITGFAGPAVWVGETPYIDGGLVRAPNGTLFSSGWPINFLFQTLPGNSTPDAAIDLNLHAINPSPGAFEFVPAGFPGAGQFKLASYNTGDWYEVDLQVQPSGLYSITLATLRTTIVGGPEGIVYVPPGSPQFTDYASVLVSEYIGGVISVYDIDANGDPIPATRRLFMDVVAGAEGATIDPVSGNFVFSTFGANNTVLVVSGFSPTAVTLTGIDASAEDSYAIPWWGAALALAASAGALVLVRRRSRV